MVGSREGVAEWDGGTLVVPNTWEAEAGESLESKFEASQDNISRPCQKEREKKY
jgi:hypothetical protein